MGLCNWEGLCRRLALWGYIYILYAVHICPLINYKDPNFTQNSAWAKIARAKIMPFYILKILTSERKK